jgi:cellulose synthase/poly-beta-1,6-N-acetylglucosamine synthase-like glycosyltransferase
VYLFIVALTSHLATPAIRDVIRRDKDDKGKSHDTLHNDTDSNNGRFVSIIIPARNEQEHIQRCLESIISQDYPSFEIIAVDDSSTDNTFRIMKHVQAEKVSLAKRPKLKIIQLTDKPHGWTGKTWASEQGYLHSKGNILLFTDADAYFNSKNTISLAVSYMQKDNLDVLTGVPYLQLRDFWSKIVMPVWMLFTEIFRTGMADMNNPKSKVAYLMGSFFLIKRDVFEQIGTYELVRNEIQEDRILGIRLKRNGYKIKIVKMDEVVTALFARDPSTLWHSIQRTLAPVAMESRLRIISHMLILFFMAALPFLLLSYIVTTLPIARNGELLPQQRPPIFLLSILLSSILPQSDGSQLSLELLFLLNIVSCLLVIIATVVKGRKKYLLPPTYCILAPIGALYLTIAYAYNIIPLILSKKGKPIIWRGRTHEMLVFSNREK